MDIIWFCPKKIDPGVTLYPRIFTQYCITISKWDQGNSDSDLVWGFTPGGEAVSRQ